MIRVFVEVELKLTLQPQNSEFCESHSYVKAVAGDPLQAARCRLTRMSALAIAMLSTAMSSCVVGWKSSSSSEWSDMARSCNGNEQMLVA